MGGRRDQRRARKAARRRARRTRVLHRVHALQRRQHRLEDWVQRRFPALWDYRHAAQGVGRLLGPLVGGLLAAAVLVPLAALATLIWNALGLQLPSVTLPSVDLPSIPVPGWLEAVGHVLGAVLDVLFEVLHWVVIAGLILFGLRRGRRTGAARKEAEAVGRPELQRRLVQALANLEATADLRQADTVGELARPEQLGAQAPQGWLDRLDRRFDPSRRRRATRPRAARRA